jgi:hypothetical protein
MRAQIDAHMLGAHETGNETYIRGLLDGLAQIDSRQVVAVADPRIVAPPFSPVPTMLTCTTSRLRGTPRPSRCATARRSARSSPTTHCAPRSPSAAA